jgi:hypothetical protein
VDGEAHVLNISTLLATVKNWLQVEVEVRHVGVLLCVYACACVSVCVCVRVCYGQSSSFVFVSIYEDIAGTIE